MSRSIPFDTKEKCEECGVVGSFDFMGDYLCDQCARQYIDSELDEHEDNEFCPCEVCVCYDEEEEE